MTDIETETKIFSPTKITDYYLSSPSRKTEKVLSEHTNDKESLNLSKDLLSSSVLLTPESSPAKENFLHENSISEHGRLIKEQKHSKPHSDVDEKTLPNHACKEVDINYKNKKTLERNNQEDSTESDAVKVNRKEPEKYESENSEDLLNPSQPKQVHIEKSKESNQKKGKSKSAAKSSSKTTSSCTATTKSRKKKAEPCVDNTLVTDFFPVRRSYRKTQSEIEKEKKQDLETRVLNKSEEGLNVEDIEGKGRGVVATKGFKRGDFVIEYAGDLIDIKSAKKREEKYAKDTSFGCYMYYFVHKNKQYCIDATAESGRLGRLINHSKIAGNCHTKLIDINDRPYLILVASRDIKSGEELLYDYGDRSKSSLESHPWLKC